MLSIFAYILCIVVLNVDSASIFDQRQNGKLNVQVDLKNLEVIALLKGNKEEYVDYDYAYDYSEMTIKPQYGTKTTTAKPLNGTNSTVDMGNFTTGTTITVSENQTMLSTQDSSQNDTTTSVAATTPAGLENTSDLANKYEISTTTSTAAPCKKGFVTNPKGECELKLQNPGNALLKLVKLSQRLKQRREDRRSNKPMKNFTNKFIE